MSKNEKSLLKPGWWVALVLKPDTAPLRCYVGQIQAISDDGIRITLVDSLTGMPAGYDLYAPHRNIESALVCTDVHDVRGFGDLAGNWRAGLEPNNKLEGDR
jgi:hypothetical protein